MTRPTSNQTREDETERRKLVSMPSFSRSASRLTQTRSLYPGSDENKSPYHGNIVGARRIRSIFHPTTTIQSTIKEPAKSRLWQNSGAAFSVSTLVRDSIGMVGTEQTRRTGAF